MATGSFDWSVIRKQQVEKLQKEAGARNDAAKAAYLDKCEPGKPKKSGKY